MCHCHRNESHLQALRLAEVVRMGETLLPLLGETAVKRI